MFDWLYIPGIFVVGVLGVYIVGRVFGLGFAKSVKDVAGSLNTHKQETKRGTRQ